MLVRKRDFPAWNLPSSWTTINSWIDDPEINFPAGHIVGNSRVWTSEELLAWVKSQPSDRRPARGICKANHEARLAVVKVA